MKIMGSFMSLFLLTSFLMKTLDRVFLGGVELGINYVIVLNTNAGLWGYNIGDTIRFVNLDPYRIIVTGRIKHFASENFLVNTWVKR